MTTETRPALYIGECEIAALEINKAMAHHYLASAHELTQRPIVGKHLASIERAMLEDRFCFDGNPIHFDPDGILLNGLHRMTAIVNTDTKWTFLVICNVPRERRLVLDTGRTRSAGQQLHMLGYKNANNLASTAALVWATLSQKARPYKLPASAYEVWQTVRNFPNLEDSLRFVGPKCKPVKATASHAAYVHFLARRDEQGDVDDFFTEIQTGKGLEDGSPTLAFRNAMINDASRRTGRLPTRQKLAMLVKAWNLWRVGGEIRVLRYITAGRGAEAWPEVETSQPWVWPENQQ